MTLLESHTAPESAVTASWPLPSERPPASRETWRSPAPDIHAGVAADLRGGMRPLPDAHPLHLIGQRVEQALRAHQAEPCAADLRRLIRAALLQPLYAFADDFQFMEQLRYNTLYRWFVGLGPGELPWSVASYAEELGRLRASAVDGARFRELVAEARALARIWPAHFRIDDALFDAWIATPKRADTGLAATLMDGDEHALSAAGLRLDAGPRNPRFEKAISVILDNLGDPELDANRVASAACVSRRSLYLLFKERGLTPSRAIRDIRLERCRQALSDPDPQQQRRKITDLALDFGFADITSFTRQFRNRYGKPPRDFRVSARTPRMPTS